LLPVTRTAPTRIYTRSLHDALPICSAALDEMQAGDAGADIGRALILAADLLPDAEVHLISDQELEVGQANVHVVGEPVANVGIRDRKSTRLNSSHVKISYAVFCLKK